jgi:hypothetical protein
MDGTVQEPGTGAAHLERRRRLRRAAAGGAIGSAAGVVTLGFEGAQFLPLWFNLPLCLALGLFAGSCGAVAGYRSGTKAEVRRDTLAAGEMELGSYAVVPVPEGAPVPPPFHEDDCTSYSLTTTTRRLQLWELDHLLQWRHPWRDLRLTAEGHVLVITGPEGLLGRFVLARMLVPEELVLASNRLRAR